ncbi:hypothetical protein C2S52_006991 [Perilla frutescens var. hirtella]|nr:hypothetical protein C2S51_008856 [Perilla frutescens var. frutescens]KAH6787439.1 hypothetical protein C2S52_006991 [Perilla frutescens var. hirtella]
MIASSRQLATKIRPIYSSKGRWVGTMSPRKQTNEDGGGACIEKEKVEPIVTFSRPPPLPPVLGPLVAISMLESWNTKDNNGD